MLLGLFPFLLIFFLWSIDLAFWLLYDRKIFFSVQVYLVFYNLLVCLEEFLSLVWECFLLILLRIFSGSWFWDSSLLLFLSFLGYVFYMVSHIFWMFCERNALDFTDVSMFSIVSSMPEILFHLVYSVGDACLCIFCFLSYIIHFQGWFHVCFLYCFYFHF